MDDEVHRPEVRQRVPADGVGLDLGQQLFEQGGGELVLEPGRHSIVVRPEADIGVPALVARAGTDEHPQRDHDGVPRRQARYAGRSGVVCGDGSDSGSLVEGGKRRGRDQSGRRTPCAASTAAAADRRRPVAGDALRARRRRGEERAGVARQARLDHGAREGPADRLLVVAADRQAQVRHARRRSDHPRGPPPSRRSRPGRPGRRPTPSPPRTAPSRPAAHRSAPASWRCASRRGGWP